MNWHARFKPMSPAPYTADGKPFMLLCTGDCGRSVASTEALCDVTDKPGAFYCKPCAARYACDTDLSHALDVIARATGAAVTPLNSPQARALEAWILENDLRNQRGPLGDAIMSAWLAEADSGQGIVEIPARWSVTGAPVTFNVWEAAS